MKKVLLYSGGMDSYLISKVWNPDVKLYVNLHSKYSEQEMKRLPSDVTITELDLSRWERSDLIIPYRNLMLCCIAANFGEEICLGATAGDRVLDKTPVFAEKASDILTYLTQKQHWTEERKIKVCVDFKNHTKTQLIREYIDNGNDWKKAFTESFSCYAGEEHECWKCKPCFRKVVAFYNCGCNLAEVMSEAELDTCRNYIENEILPQIKSGNYGRGKEEEEQILNFYYNR